MSTCNPSKAAFLTDFSITLIKGQTTRTLNKVRSMKDSFKHDAMLKILMSNSFFRRSWGGFNQRCVRPDRRRRRDSETGDPVAKEPGGGPGVPEQEEGVHKVPGEPGSRPGKPEQGSHRGTEVTQGIVYRPQVGLLLSEEALSNPSASFSKVTIKQHG